ncbi:MAG TPA: AMP-binding protein [Myxococcaceae bacterium]|nr:AMP-binding protein [Myxococcaceae bacterium]
MTAMPFYDALEGRDPEQRERALFAALPGHIAHARSRAAAFASLHAGVDPGSVTSRRALAALPVMRKSGLAEMQKAAPPFGGVAAIAAAEAARLFTSPGGIYEPEGRRPDYWRVARALFAAGFRKGDVVHVGFSFHLTPAGSMVETAAHALGCAVIPGGTAPTEHQVLALAHFGATAYGGTPSFLKVLLDRAAELGADTSRLKRASVAAEPFPASLRTFLAERGVLALQWYGTADAGLVAYESEGGEGLILDESVILEIVRPGTSDPVPDGEVGEVLVTVLNPDYPLLRFSLGDLSAVLPGKSPCGRTNVRLRGWLGRADQRTKVKGLFVDPSQIADLLRRHPEVVRARLVVTRADEQDRMTLRCEVAGGGAAGLAETVAATLRELTQLRGEVELVAPGSLPNDGKVVEDTRTYT